MAVMPGLVAGALQRLAAIGGAAVLPDDGAVDRPAGVALPDQRGLALISDADGGNRRGADAGLADGIAAGGQHRVTRSPRHHARRNRDVESAAVNSSCATATTCSLSSKTMARDDDVP